MLKSFSIKDEVRKFFSNRTLFDDSTFEKIDFFDQLQKTFSRTIYLVHFDKRRVLYIDVNVFKEREFEIMIYHFKIDFVKSKSSSSKNKEVKSIMFMSKILSQAKLKYWSTELKMTKLIWVIIKVHVMIRSSNQSTIVYTNHEVTSKIAS